MGQLIVEHESKGNFIIFIMIECFMYFELFFSIYAYSIYDLDFSDLYN